MKRFWILAVWTFAMGVLCPAISAETAEGISLAGDWRITRVAPAPWAASEASTTTHRSWIGKGVHFDATSIEGPGVFHCDNASLEKTRFGAESLFQGNLPVPANVAAEALGIAHFPRPGVRLNCSTGVFEFHFVDADTMLTALDNQIITFNRAGATQAPERSPEGRIQRFLERHFAGDMGFTPESASAYRGWLSVRLAHAIKAYFAKPSSADEVPAVDGDPFTGTQEYPTRFFVGKSNISGDRASLPVRFSDAFGDREILYLMVREGGEWQLDDVRLDGEATFSSLIQ